MKLTEILDLFDRKIKTRDVKPAVEKHRPVSAGQHKPVAIDPFRFIRIDIQRFAVKNCTHFCLSKLKAEVAGRAGVNRIDGESASFVGSF